MLSEEQIVIIFVALLVILVSAGLRYSRTARNSFTRGRSSLLVHYTQPGTGIHLMSLTEGVMDDGSYYNVLSAGDNMLYVVQLPFQTKLHMLAVAQASGLFSGASLVERSPDIRRVELEGDFIHYFQLYVSPQYEKQVRYILDPKAMAYVIDFCRSNTWELLNDELYIVVGRSSEQSVTLQEIASFTSEIRPVVADVSTAAVSPHRLNTNQARALLRAHCPICQAALVAASEWHRCPEGHGYLLTGKELARLRSRELTVTDDTAEVSLARDPHHAIDCPVCRHPMALVPYGARHTIIDSCTNCMYRWLDSGEEKRVSVSNVI